VKSGELDLALMYEYDFVPFPADHSVEQTHLMDDPIRVVLPQGHRAARRRAVRLDELADESWITSTARSSCHEFVSRACRAAGFEPQIGFESDDHGVWQGLVAAGVGVALAPELALETLYPGVQARPVALSPLKRRIFTVHRAGGHSPAIDAMLGVIAETIAAREERPAAGPPLVATR
jgi:DNA-binding transcriptional LysR family regulator